MKHDAFKKVINPGKAPDGLMFCEIEFNADGNLSITGVIGPKRNGDARGSCGQIVDHLCDLETLQRGWTQGMVDGLRQAWKAWHLNDLRAGSPEQNAELSKHQFPGYPVSHYKWAVGVLEAAGLHPDENGYKYGSAWLREDVPAEVVAFLRDLPETSITPAWV